MTPETTIVASIVAAAQRKFIDTIAPLAVADWKEHRVLPSLTLAQAVIESAFGTSELATKANALFGIKASAPWAGKTYTKNTQEWDGTKYITVSAVFRAYNSWDESIKDHGEFLQKDRYAKVRGEKDYKLACKYIKDAGYATSPTYTKTLIDTIEKNGLTAYDSVVHDAPVGGDSPLVSGSYFAHSKRNHPRNKPITKITPHHCAGNTTHQGMINILNSSREMSCNYLIQTDGRIFQYVHEEDRSWCSSSAENDHMAITIEVANDGGAPDWHISDAAFASLINLCVDICQRNNIPALNFTGNANGNLTQHNYFSATECPGPYLKSKFPEIAAEVNKMLSSEPTPEPGGNFEKMLLKSFGTKNMQGFSFPDANGVIAYDRMPNGYRLVTERNIKGTDGQWEWVKLLDERNGNELYTPLLPDRNQLLDDAPALLPPGGGETNTDAILTAKVALANSQHTTENIKQVLADLGVGQA